MNRYLLELIVTLENDTFENCSQSMPCSIIYYSVMEGVCTTCKSKQDKLNPNRHEAGWIYPPYNFRIDFWQLNFYQKLPNIFGGEN